MTKGKNNRITMHNNPDGDIEKAMLNEKQFDMFLFLHDESLS
jgi:hypothetical protein